MKKFPQSHLWCETTFRIVSAKHEGIKLGDAEIARLAKAMARDGGASPMPHLRELCLQFAANRISEEGAKSIAEMLRDEKDIFGLTWHCHPLFL